MSGVAVAIKKKRCSRLSLMEGLLRIIYGGRQYRPVRAPVNGIGVGPRVIEVAARDEETRAQSAGGDDAYDRFEPGRPRGGGGPRPDPQGRSGCGAARGPELPHDAGLYRRRGPQAAGPLRRA